MMDANYARSAKRNGYPPTARGDHSGFRIGKDIFPIDIRTITITEPTGSDTVWLTGYPADITWATYGTISDVKIDLYKGGTLNQTIVQSTPNNGSYTWTEVDTSLVNGMDYKIRITDSSDSSIYGDSYNFWIEE